MSPTFQAQYDDSVRVRAALDSWLELTWQASTIAERLAPLTAAQRSAVLAEVNLLLRQRGEA